MITVLCALRMDCIPTEHNTITPERRVLREHASSWLPESVDPCSALVEVDVDAVNDLPSGDGVKDRFRM